jgi:hypothetical protein
MIGCGQLEIVRDGYDARAREGVGSTLAYTKIECRNIDRCSMTKTFCQIGTKPFLNGDKTIYVFYIYSTKNVFRKNIEKTIDYLC